MSDSMGFVDHGEMMEIEEERRQRRVRLIEQYAGQLAAADIQAVRASVIKPMGLDKYIGMAHALADAVIAATSEGGE